MTLARLLIAGVSLVFLLVLTGVEVISVRNTQRYLQEQLDAHAHETATSLALTIGALMEAPESALAETIINPVFDRGYFARVALLTVSGEVLVERLLQPAPDAVPIWFQRMFPLAAPSGEALANARWRQLGRVVITVDPRFAYQQLWRSAYETLTWFALIYAVALLAVGRLVALMLRPIERVEQAALAISNRDFSPVTIEGGTAELRRVAAAMNSLAGKVREAIAGETARAERLLREAYQDPVTGQQNWRGFASRVSVLLEGDSAVGRGALALFTVRGLEQMNQSEGTLQGDTLLRDLGTQLAAVTQDPARNLGRRHGAAFAVFLADARPEEAEHWAHDTVRALSAAVTARGFGGVSVCAGLTRFDGNSPLLADLEQWAELALSQAVQRGAELAVLDFDREDASVRPRSHLSSTIVEALEAGRMTLYAQKALGLPGHQVLHHEITVRLTAADGDPIAAAVFVPQASRLGLMPGLDAAVARRLAELATLPPRVAINVSWQSIAHPAYREEMRELLARRPDFASRAVIEVSAQRASLDLESTARFAQELRAAGAEFALDDVELSSEALRLVHRLLPTYVKLAQAYTVEFPHYSDVRFLVESLVAILRPLEVAVIVKGLESTDPLDKLAAAGVTGYQGYAGGRPSPLG
jgi:EAL domain-containing protein (putative c-di-GMP-specific phosphodiesterase class I)/GGDEF domain-containing protein